MKADKRNYRATFILDNRGKEETIDQIVDGVKKVIAEVKGEVTGVEAIAHRRELRAREFRRPGRRARQSSRKAAPQRQRLSHLHPERLSAPDQGREARTEAHRSPRTDKQPPRQASGLAVVSGLSLVLRPQPP